MTLRLVIAALVLVVATLPARGEEFRLRARATVEGGVVTLGDVLEGAGAAAEAVVARAPEPGHRMAIGVSHVFAVARAQGLAWRPLRGNDRIVVRRASRRIGRAEIRDRLRAALAEQAPGQNFAVELPARVFDIHLPTDVPATLAIEDLRLDRARGHVSATLIAAPETPSARRIDISARAVAMAEVPVLRRPVRRDGVIEADDVAWTEIRRSRVAASVITDPADLVGMSARRSLRAGRPLRRGDVRAPVAVRKGRKVVMTYRTEAMVLTVVGRALDDAAVGETVRVLNTQSNVVVRASVESDNLVTVTSHQQLAHN